MSEQVATPLLYDGPFGIELCLFTYLDIPADDIRSVERFKAMNICRKYASHDRSIVNTITLQSAFG